MSAAATEHRETWGSRLGFILATAGYAVGLGNIWRFPYLVGENGGGAFLLLYLVFAVLFGVPLLTTELSLGRQSQLSPIAGMQRLTGSRRSPWNVIGWLGVGAMLVILAYYVMLTAWIVAYTGLLALGRPLGTNAVETAQRFSDLTRQPGPQLVISLLLVIVLVLVIRQGLQKGLERLAKVAMPLLLFMLVGLAIWSVTLDGAAEGLAFYLTPDFGALDAGGVLAALGQACFSIGIGVGAAFALGSYLPPGHSDIPGSTAIVVAMDTGIAMLAGFVIFPALFSLGMSPDQGPALLFVTMAAVFGQMPGGHLFGFGFFALLTVAALTSVIAAYALLTSVGQDSLGLTRKGAAAAAGACTWVCAALVILTQGPWSEFRVADMQLFPFLDRLASDYMATTGAFVMALYVVFSWGWQRYRDETNRGSGLVKVNRTWRPFVMFVIPVAVGTVLVLGLGIF
jgi:NSS family neurotransmitter:Na+ symporter